MNMNAKAKKTTKTPRPKTAAEPSADASPRFKRLIKGDADATPAPESTPAEPFATLADLGKTWIEYLKANDAAVSTWASYQADFETAAEHFGAATDPATLTPDAVAAFEQSDAVTKTKKGRPKAMPTVLKTRRVLRLALTWARDLGRLASIPYAAKTAS
jgi:hypothetical protein